MASGGGNPYRKLPATDPRQKSSWQRTTSTSDKDDNISLNSLPNDLRPNNWDFSDWKPSSASFDNPKRRKKGNPEREREQSLSQDSPPPSERQHRTPSTYPRTRITPSTPTSQKVALENLKQQLTFSDNEDASNDGERNNERSVPIRRGRPPNFTRQDTSSTEGASWSRNDTSLQRSRNLASPNNVDGLFSDTGPNSGQIVGRLMQIREYIKQANVMMEALNKSGDPQAHREDLGKLRKLAESLQEQENSYLGLLQQALTMKVENTDVDGTIDRDEIPRPDSAEDRQSVDIDVKSESDDTATDNDVDPVDGNSDLMALKQQQELLKKLLQQKEQMTALKERQRALIALQKDAEAKLAEAKAYEASMNSLGGQSVPQRQSRPVAVENLLGTESDGTPGSLLDIRKHFNLLRNELKESANVSRNEERPAENTRQSNPAIEAAAAEAASALDDNRQQLQNKLEELHEKKQKMDSLLQELQILRTQRVEDLMNNGLQNNNPIGSVPRTNSEVRISDSQAAAQHAEATEEDATEVLKMLEAEEKLRKLKEVKERLNQLKSLMQYYQTTEGAEKDNDNRRAIEIPVEHSSHVSPNNEQQIREIPVERASELEPRSDDDNKSDSSSTTEEGTESHLSSLGPWGDDPEIQEKVRKLKAAKDKLKQLQDLVSMVQHSPDAAQSLPENLMELAGSLDDGEYAEGVDKGTELSEGEIPNTQEERDSYYAAKMQEQMDELDQLKTERQRLLTIQQELQTLNARFPAGQVEATAIKEVEAERTHKRPKQTTAKQVPDEQEVEGSDRAPVVTFSSNDEVYDKMRRQRMLREELRQKKREVEAIMKKDGSRKSYGKNQDAQSDTVSFSTDAFGGAASADATMATWGGSTVDNLESITEDGVDGNQGSDNEEVDDGYPSDGIVQVEEEEEEFDNETYTIENDVRQRRMARTEKSTTKQRSYPRSRIEAKGGARPKQRSFTKKQKKIQQRQENFRSAEEIVQDEDDEEKSASLQEQINRLTELCQSLLQRDSSNNLLQPAPVAYSYQQNPDLVQQFQQQQTLMMNQCLQQMCMQQLELQNMQRQLNMVTDPNYYDRDLRLRSLQSLPTDSRNLSPNLESRQNLFNVQPQFPSSFYGRRSNDSSPQINAENLLTSNRLSSSQNASKKTSSSRNKNFYEQYLSSEKKESAGQPSRGMDDVKEKTVLPQLNFDDLRNRRKLNGQKDWSTVSLASQSKHESERPDRDRDDDVTRRGLSTRARQLLEDMYRPGLSAGISGAGFRENISIASTLSQQLQESPGKDTRESDDGVDLSLFEALREGIYSEVATLISQNENRPHFLIELFRELQKLNTDYLRQRALYAIRDVASKFLSEQSNDISATAPPPAWLNTEAVNKCSDTESTPSESIVTTDMEENVTEIRQQPKARTQLQNNMLLRGESVSNDAFDYIENADNDSSLSTPSNSYWENPFAQDSLGDTAINLNKALQKMRECEKKMAEEEAKIKRLENARLNRQISEPCSSSALDPGSDRESSVSSISPKIDTQQVDRQIKSIMTEIIPVIKQHMDNVCSSELLTYIKRLVLSLTRQKDGTSQYARFYHTQLGSSLQDTLSKFEGRKMRECGEDLLVDMSEVLFNELAFFKLMQGIDVPTTVDKEQQTSMLKTSSTQTGEDQRQEVEESEQTQESDTETTSSAEEQDVNTSIKLMENEEEELGKSRDDDFASEVQIKDAEEKDEDTESPYKIELAVSEITPFTRIGSDEDDEDADEAQSADDPSETAVSRDAMMERSHDNDDGTTDGMPDEESFVKISKEDADQGANTSKESKTTDPQVNGEVLVNGEITIDDLPPTLDVCQGDVQQRFQEEQSNNSGTAAAISTIDTDQELAGDGLFLKEPDELKME